MEIEFTENLFFLDIVKDEDADLLLKFTKKDFEFNTILRLKKDFFGSKDETNKQLSKFKKNRIILHIIYDITSIITVINETNISVEDFFKEYFPNLEFKEEVPVQNTFIDYFQNENNKKPLEFTFNFKKVSVVSHEELITKIEKICSTYFCDKSDSCNIGEICVSYKYLNDGICAHKATFLKHILKEEGIIVGKIYISGLLNYESSIAIPQYWDYHIALVVLVRVSDTRNELRIIDFSFDKHPLDIYSWMTKVCKNVHSPVFVESNHYELCVLLNGSFNSVRLRDSMNTCGCIDSILSPLPSSLIAIPENYSVTIKALKNEKQKYC